MKNLFLSIICVLFLLISGCSSDRIAGPADTSSQSGKALLKIDKVNAPSNVAFITAYITLNGVDTLQANLNLLTDSTASITFNNLAVGTWKLRVDAKESSGKIVYSGTAMVDVSANQVSNVSITLNPVDNPTGGISIYVNWGGQATTSWIDYYNNPLLSANSFPYCSNGVLDPRIILDGGVYKMWCAGWGYDNKVYIMYATSPDGLNWKYQDSLPVLSPGNLGTYCEREVDPGAIIKDQNGYKMYFSGLSAIGRWSVGLATSTNGITWTKTSQPILSGAESWEYNIGVSDVIKVGNYYYMYYHGTNTNIGYVAKIGLAISSDGVNFTKYSGNPILTKTQDWEGMGVYCASVINDSGVYKMVYMNATTGSDYGFGMATSSDGINWVKDATNPFFTNYMTCNNWALRDASYPFFRKFNNEYRVYYTSMVNNKRCFGVVRKTN